MCQDIWEQQKLHAYHSQICVWKREWRSASLAYVQVLVAIDHGRLEYAQLIVRGPRGSIAVHCVEEPNSVPLSLLGLLQARNLVHNDRHRISKFEYA